MERQAAEYWAAIVAFLPVAVVGGVVAMVARLRKIKHAPDWKDRILDLIITGLVGAVVAVVTVMVAPLFYSGTSPSVELAIGAVAGSYGLKAFDLLMERILGKGARHHED